MLCSLVEVYHCFTGACCLHHHPEDESSQHFWNVSKFLPDYNAQQPRRQPSSYSLPWESEISWKNNQWYLLKCFIHKKKHMPLLLQNVSVISSSVCKSEACKNYEECWLELYKYAKEHSKQYQCWLVNFKNFLSLWKRMWNPVQL
jgi:hypothetical protein